MTILYNSFVKLHSKKNRSHIMTACYSKVCYIGTTLYCFQRKQMYSHYKFELFWFAVTLKIRARSPKPIQVLTMPQCYIHANLNLIDPLVHEISFTQSVTLTPMLTPKESTPKTTCPLPFGRGT